MFRSILSFLNPSGILETSFKTTDMESNYTL